MEYYIAFLIVGIRQKINFKSASLVVALMTKIKSTQPILRVKWIYGHIVLQRP